MNETILSQQERTCTECGRKFVIPRMDLWVYKLSVKGKTIWFCRYNCMRAGEKKINALKVGRGRWRKEMAKKPPKEELEKDLRSGMSRSEIAKKYGAAKITVYNWIKNYGLQDLSVDKDAEGEPVGQAPVVMVQGSPTLAEIEQFHTDNPVQELPNVEMGPVLTDKALKPFEEVWQGIQDDLAALQRSYVKTADQEFRERLREMLAKVVGTA